MAETFKRQGHRVFAGARDISGRNRAPAEALRSQGVEVVELDVTDDKSVDAGVAAVLAATGNRLDVLVNNAGIATAGVSEAFTSDQVRELYNTNVVGIHRVLRAALPALRAKADGLVVNVSSIVGRVNFPFFGLYNGTKFAVEAITEGYRYELSQLGVDVILVQPSAYPTNLFAAIRQPGDAARAASYGAVAQIPGKMFESFQAMFTAKDAPNPHDVAKAVAGLIDAPKGTRPFRTVIGQSFGADTINAATAPIQEQALTALGLAHLDRVAV
jgi:NADP-dependent 3-hydroxy acid dehydrogenase YdfG